MVASVGRRKTWICAWAVMAAVSLVDLDHLLADPLYDPNRCSIGYHPLHSWPAQGVWVALALWPKTRVVGVEGLTHMTLDAIDCVFMP